MARRFFMCPLGDPEVDYRRSTGSGNVGVIGPESPPKSRISVRK
jgi:hypothetical protein